MKISGNKGKGAKKESYSLIICPHCGMRLRINRPRQSYMYCPTGKVRSDSLCSSVKIRRDFAEDTLLRLVRQQTELVIEAEKVMRDKRQQETGNKGLDEKKLRTELKRLEDAKIADYEKYKAGMISRERFIEKKADLDAEKKEVASAIAECEAQNMVDDDNQRLYAEAFKIKEYASLEVFDKVVMASLISSAKVIGEDCLEVTWKHHDIFKKILLNL
jgi:predicted transcriptional regulator